MATEVNITSDASGNAVRFRSTGREDLPKSAGKVVSKDNSGTHGQVNTGNSLTPQIIFDNPGQ
jgi:hypothetical protein